MCFSLQRDFGKINIYIYFSGLASCSWQDRYVLVRNKADMSCWRDTDQIMLPPHFKYRKIFENWVFERGWVIKIKNNSKVVYAPYYK